MFKMRSRPLARRLGTEGKIYDRCAAMLPTKNVSASTTQACRAFACSFHSCSSCGLIFQFCKPSASKIVPRCCTRCCFEMAAHGPMNLTSPLVAVSFPHALSFPFHLIISYHLVLISVLGSRDALMPPTTPAFGQKRGANAGGALMLHHIRLHTTRVFKAIGR